MDLKRKYPSKRSTRLANQRFNKKKKSERKTMFALQRIY